MRELAPRVGVDPGSVRVDAEPEQATQAGWRGMAFGGDQPPPEVVAHELVHVAQQRRFGPGGGATTTARDAPDEREARALAPRVAAGEHVDVRQRPTAALQTWTGTDLAGEADERPGARELSAAVRRRRPGEVLAILEANQAPEHMAQLRSDYEPGFIEDLHWILRHGPDRTNWDQARVYLGDQLGVDEEVELEQRVFGGEPERILAAIESRSDEEMLAIVAGREHFPGLLDIPPPGTGPQQTSFLNMRRALRSALEDGEYYRAMSVVLAKASRANTRHWEEQGSWALVVSEPSIEVEISTDLLQLPDTGFGWDDDILVDVPDAPPAVGSVQLEATTLLPLFLDPSSRLRVELAVERVVDADESNDWSIFAPLQPPSLGQAKLALSVLDRRERAAAWLQLEDRQWSGFTEPQVAELEALARETDDVHALVTAITDADLDRDVEWSDVKVALDRLREMVREAATGVARARSDEELQHWERRLSQLQSWIKSPELQTAIGTWPEFAAELPALDVAPERIGIQALRRVDDLEGLLGVITGLSTEARLDRAFQASVRWKAQRLDLDENERQLVDSYLDIGLTDARAGDRFARVALHEMRTAFEDDQPHRAVSVLHRMSPEQRTAFVASDAYKRWFKGLVWKGHEGRLLHLYLDKANQGDTVGALRTAAIERNLFDFSKVSIREPDAYAEYVGASGESKRDRRRGFVLWSRLQQDPRLELSDEDRQLVEAYTHHRRLVEGADPSWSKREAIDNVFFGQPQLQTTAEGAVDPNVEADFMFHRVAARKRLSGDWRTLPEQLRSWDGSYIGTDVTEFLLTFAQLRPSGIDRADLAILAEQYHRAMREADELKREADMASVAASIVGCVVAVAVVTVLSGGTMGPVAIGAVAALAGGVAAATTGAMLRTESSDWELFRDFGTGAVEGAMAVAGAGIAARVVRMGQVGATVNAAAAGGQAVQAATQTGAAAQIATAVIDGAISGAAGEIFKTATDEATWDRSVSEAFSKVLAAFARGAKSGAIWGGAFGAAFAGLGAIARRFGDDAGARIADLVSAADVAPERLNGLSEASQDALVAAERLAAQGDIDGALVRVREIAELAGDDVAKIERSLRAIRITEATLETGLERADVVRRIHEVDAEEFARIAEGAKGNAVVKITPDGPQVYVKAGTDPLVVREEVFHLHQWATDPTMRARIDRLAESRLAEASGVDRVELYKAKLEVEADAQRRIIGMLEGQAAKGDAAAADELAAAHDTLHDLGQRLDDVYAGRISAEDITPQDLRLYSKGAPTKAAPEQAANWKEVQEAKVLNADPSDPAIQKKLTDELGYSIHKGPNGEVTRIAAPSGGRATNSHARLTISQTEAGPRIVKGGGIRTHADRMDDAARVLRRQRTDVAELRQGIGSGQLDPDQLRKAHEELAALRPALLDELAGRVASGKLDDGSAGLIAHWGGVMEDLQRRTGRSYSDLMGEAGSLQRAMGEADYRNLRVRLRTIAAEHLATVTPGSRQRSHLMEMLDLQPDNKSRGELFTAYRKETMRRRFPDEDVVPGHDIESLHVPGSGKLKKQRTPDDVVEQHIDLEGFLPSGRYAVDDKVGNAFKLDQAEDYARAMIEGPKRRTATGPLVDVEYDGIVYVFTDEGYAKLAYKKMQENRLTAQVLDRSDRGIHVLFLDDDGVLKKVLPDSGGARAR